MPRSASGFSRCPAVLLAAVLAAASVLAAAEGPSPVVTAVAVFVDGRPADADMAALVPLVPGEPFSLKRIDAAVKQIYLTGLFADVQVLRDGEDDVRLTVLLERRLIVRKVLFQGGSGVSMTKLRESLYAIRPDAPYSEVKKSRAVEELRESLRKEGYLNCAVEASIRRVEGQAGVDVTFKIVPGPRFTLREVEFPGGDLGGGRSFKKARRKPLRPAL